MAHFAEIDENNNVINVIVVNDEDTADEDGNEVEAIGVEFCHDLLGGRPATTTTSAATSQESAQLMTPTTMSSLI